MKNDSNNQRESLWRQPLSKAERARLHSQPELELEARLTDALAKMPDAPVPSNFTERVLHAVELDEKRAVHARGWSWNWRSLLPRTAAVATVLLVLGLGIQHHQTEVRRAAVAKSLILVADAKLPSVDALNNFDVIQRMSQPHADDELLALLQ